MVLKPIPGAEELVWKDIMLERYGKLTDIEQFKKYSLSFLRKSVRINTLKGDIPEVKKWISRDWNLTSVPWCKEGFWVEHKQGRLDVGNTIEHALGFTYVQEAASMIPPVVLAPQPGDHVLDLCAAPGSKTTQLAQYMHNEGLLIANDITADRLAALGINLQRCGVTNVVVTEMHGMKGQTFDKVLVDAPCTGTGTIRKSLRTLRTWSPDATRKMCGAQNQCMERAWSMLRPGGIMVYSTCALEPEEDEGMVSHFLSKHDDADIEPFELDIKRGTPVTEWEGTEYDPRVEHTLRIWPQDNDTEGFFVARLRKED